MNVLGVHIGHDSQVALVVDGRIIADVAEERFVRIKHFAGVPSRAIEYCLKQGGISIEDIDIIAIPTGCKLPILNHLFDLPGGRRERGNMKAETLQFARRLTRSIIEKPPIYWKRFPIRSSTQITHVDHHLSHAASAYLMSGIPDKTIVVTCDGVGDGHSFCIWLGENGQLTPLELMGWNASIGCFYSNVTEALGWIHGDGEGKTMGLAPYGDYAHCKGCLDKFYPKFADGHVVEPHDFGQPYHWNEEGYFEYHYDEANEILDVMSRHSREDVAAEAQRILEEQVMNVVLPWLAREKTASLACAGGVFLNVKLNQRIWESGKVKRHFIYPNPGDAGLAVGAAAYVFCEAAGRREVLPALEHLYWGPEFAQMEVEKILKDRNLSFRRCENVETETAKLLAANKIVGWFQGRMESGPRALGNRSILMSPSRAENKDIINARVKYREAFRPFCPSLPVESRTDYLANSREELFMITSFDVTADKKNRVPAVVHADGTLRPQTVRRDLNPRFWNLLNEFGRLTGDPVLLNTSLNIKGEPMICHPREAIRCFYDSGIDVLVIGDLMLTKS
jgi:carbamoyltransferase